VYYTFYAHLIAKLCVISNLGFNWETHDPGKCSWWYTNRLQTHAVMIFCRWLCFFVLDAMMRSVGRVELLYENHSWCIISFTWLERVHYTLLRKQRFFSFFFPFERFCYRCGLIHRVRLFGQSGTRTDASALCSTALLI